MFGADPWSLNAYGSSDAGGASPSSSLASLLFNGTFSYASVPHTTAFQLSDSDFTGELRVTHSSVGAGRAAILTNSTDIENGILIERDSTSLKIYLSSDGTSWDIANGTAIGTITVSEYYLTWTRLGGEIIFFLNGTESARIATEDAIYDPGEGWQVGYYAGRFMSEMTVHAWRVNIGNVRYASDHEATATPFADSDSYSAGTVYSDNFALFMGDIASSGLYGLGAPVDGLAESKEWCATLLDDELTAQATGGLVLPASRRAEYWLNILGDYAACLWFPYGDKIRIQPDKGLDQTTPSGQEVCEHGEFDASTGWTENDWSIGSGVASVDGTQATETALARSLTTEDGEDYGVAINITTITAGAVSVEIGGVEVISAQNSAGTYYGAYQASGVSNDIEIIASDDCVASVGLVSVRRLFWLQEGWLPGSIRIDGSSVRDTPNRVSVSYQIPAADTPNWSQGEGVATLPDAADGSVPLVTTQISMPGLPTLQQASNRALRKINRTRNRMDVSFLSRSTGVLHRKGDGVHLKKALRGVDIRMWVEDVELRDYGHYIVSGVVYSNSHFTLSTGLDIFEAPYDHDLAEQGEKFVGDKVYIANPDSGEMAYATVIDRDADTGALLVSVNAYGTLLGTMNLLGTNFTLPANVGSPTVGFAVSSLASSDVIVVDKVEDMTHAAFSWWGMDGVNPSGDWGNPFAIKDDFGDTFYFDEEYSATSDAAEARMISQLPIVRTGSTSYTLFGRDDPIDDNRGGISVRIWQF